MTTAGARGLVSISQNPNCHLQAYMVTRGFKEQDFYRQVTGNPFPEGYRGRQSAFRRGRMFEKTLFADNALLLRKALAERFDFEVDEAEVLNLEVNFPGSSLVAKAQRLALMKKVFVKLAAGEEVPQLIIQPQLALPTK